MTLHEPPKSPSGPWTWAIRDEGSLFDREIEFVEISPVTVLRPDKLFNRFEIYELTAESGEVNAPKAWLIAEDLLDKLEKNCLTSFKIVATESGKETNAVVVVNTICKAWEMSVDIVATLVRMPSKTAATGSMVSAMAAKIDSIDGNENVSNLLEETTVINAPELISLLNAVSVCATEFIFDVIEDKSLVNEDDCGIKDKTSMKRSKTFEDSSDVSEVAIELVILNKGATPFAIKESGWERADESGAGNELEKDTSAGAKDSADVAMFENASTDACNADSNWDEGNSDISSLISIVGKLSRNCGIEASVVAAVFKPSTISFTMFPTSGIFPTTDSRVWNNDTNELINFTTALMILSTGWKRAANCDEKDETEDVAAV